MTIQFTSRGGGRQAAMNREKANAECKVVNIAFTSCSIAKTHCTSDDQTDRTENSFASGTLLHKLITEDISNENLPKELRQEMKDFLDMCNAF